MTPEQKKALREPFPAEMVGKLPKGGTTLDYVGHGAVTDRLLEVDPEWQWEPLSVDEHGFPRLDLDGNLWIKLTVCGVTRLGVGDGPNMKVLIGDALRNAAMRFGVALDLWIRGHAEDDEKAPQQQARRREAKPAEPKADHGTHEAIRSVIANMPDDLVAEFRDWYTANGLPSIKGHDALTERQATAVLDHLDEFDKPSPLEEAQDRESLDGAAPGPASPVVKPATNKPSAAARAALEGKPALGAVKRTNDAPDSLALAAEAFPGAEVAS